MPRLLLRLWLSLPLPPLSEVKAFMTWDWKKLIIAVLTAVLGWLSSAVIPGPGTQKIPVVQAK